MKRIFLILILSLLTVAAFSLGNNSMNITILGSRNYSTKLSDYYSPKNAGMITVIVRNQDVKEPVFPIQLYMSVTNNGKTTETEVDLHKNLSQTLITDGKGDSLVYSQNGHHNGHKRIQSHGRKCRIIKGLPPQKRFAGAVDYSV